MNRRSALKGLGLAALALAGGGGALAMLRTPANPYYNGPVSDHFDGLRFRSPGRAVHHKSRMELLRWRLTGTRTPWPDRFPSPYADRPPRRVDGGLRAAFVGHASHLIQTGGLNILVDPHWSDRASPFSFAGPARRNAPGIALADLPPIDAVLVTHNHYDHMDVATLSRLARAHGPRIIVPLGNDAILREADADLAPRLTALDWGGAVALSDRVEVTLEPSLHWSARWLDDRSMALWGSFVVAGPAGRVFCCGDTGYDPDSIFPRIRAKHGPIRLALLPIGAYEPRWFMREQHANPAEAVRIFQELGAEAALGMHWGTFQLTDEGIEAPREALAVALAEAGIDPRTFPAQLPGQVWEA